MQTWCNLKRRRVQVSLNLMKCSENYFTFVLEFESRRSSLLPVQSVQPDQPHNAAVCSCCKWKQFVQYLQAWPLRVSYSWTPLRHLVHLFVMMRLLGDDKVLNREHRSHNAPCISVVSKKCSWGFCHCLEETNSIPLASLIQWRLRMGFHDHSFCQTVTVQKQDCACVSNKPSLCKGYIGSETIGEPRELWNRSVFVQRSCITNSFATKMFAVLSVKDDGSPYDTLKGHKELSSKRISCKLLQTEFCTFTKSHKEVPRMIYWCQKL